MEAWGKKLVKGLIWKGSVTYKEMEKNYGYINISMPKRTNKKFTVFLKK